MTIAFLIYEYAHEKTPVYGGIGTYFKVLAKKLIQRGIEVHIFLYNPDFAYKTFFDDNLKIVVLDNYFKNRFLIEKLKKTTYRKKYITLYSKLIALEHNYIAKNFLRFIENKNIDIIQTHDYLGISSHLKTKIPKIIHCSGSATLLKEYFNYNFENIIYKTRTNLEKQAFNNTNYAVAVSKFTADSTQKLFNLKAIKVINNGIDPHLFNNDAIEIPYSIFYFGTIRKTKGIDIIASVFNQIIKKVPKATLHIIGRGEDYWKTIHKNSLSEDAKKNSIYYGPIVRNQMIPLIKKASVFIFPTHGETFGFTFIEAMILGKPIIVSNIEVSKEIIAHKKDGFIAKNKQDYIKYILELFADDTKRKKIGKNAKQKVLNNFTVEHMVNNTIALYEHILNEN